MGNKLVPAILDNHSVNNDDDIIIKNKNIEPKIRSLQDRALELDNAYENKPKSWHDNYVEDWFNKHYEFY